MKPFYLNYVYLIAAIAGEAIATSALKSAEGFTRLKPSLIVIVGYAVSFYLLSQVLKTIPVGITYATWCGLGILLVSIIGVVVFKQIPDTAAIIGMGLIVAGILIMHLFSKTLHQ